MKPNIHKNSLRLSLIEYRKRIHRKTKEILIVSLISYCLLFIVCVVKSQEHYMLFILPPFIYSLYLLFQFNSYLSIEKKIKKSLKDQDH